MLSFKNRFFMFLLLTVTLLFLGQSHAAWSKSDRPALYEFGAGRCATCKEMAKIIEELKATLSDKVEFRMIYVDKEKPLSQQYKIMLIPTQVFINADGQEVDRHVGALTKEELLAKLKKLKFIAP
mgnify:FL=1